MKRKHIIILMLTIGGLMVITSFLYTIKNPNLPLANNPLFPLGLIGVLIMILSSSVARIPMEEDDRVLQELRNKYNILNIIVEASEITGDNIVYGNKEFAFIGYDSGYNLQTAVKLIKKHLGKCEGKMVLVRHEAGGFSTGTMYGRWGIYASTGREVK